MLSMRLRQAFGPYPPGVTLLFAPATSSDVRPGDMVLAGLNDEDLLPHLITDSGGVTPFGYIVGERSNIRYRAIAVTTPIDPL